MCITRQVWIQTLPNIYNLKQLDIRIKSDWLKRIVKRHPMHIKTKGFFSHNIIFQELHAMYNI